MKKQGIKTEYYFENVENLHYHLAKATPLPSNIPFQTKGFIGRDKELEDLRRTKDKGISAFILWGMPGVGKTQLAQRFIEEIKDEYQAHIKVDMKGVDQPLTASETMFEVVKSFDPGVPADLTETEIERRFSFSINQHKTLLFLDNANDEFQFSTLNIQNSLLIITSRQNLVIDGGKSKEIKVLNNMDAKKLLFSIAERRLFKGRSNELVKLAGNLPLALKPLAVILQRRLLDIGELIEEYQIEIKRLDLKDPLQGGSNISAIFSLSEKFLGEESKEFWLKMGVFPADFDVEAAAFVTETPGKDAKKKLRNLVSRSLTELIEFKLIEPVQTKHIERYRLHDLIQAYVRNKIDDDQLQELQKRHSIYYGQVVKNLDQVSLKNLREFDLERSNVELGFKWIEEEFHKSTSDSSLCFNYTSGFNILGIRLHPKKFIDWMNLGLQASRELNYKKGETYHLGGIANAWWSLGNTQEAIKNYEEALKIAGEIDFQEAESLWLGGLGNSYKSRGDFRRSIELYNQALEISKKIYYRQGECLWLGGLGVSYWSIGNYQAAIENYEAALSIAREISDKQRESLWLGNLAAAYISLGEYAKAIEYYRDGLKISRKLRDHQRELHHLNGLGNAYWSLGEYQQAIKNYKKSLGLADKISDEQGKAALLGNLGNSYKSLWEFNKAITYYEPALAITQKIGDRLGESTWLGNIGNAYFNLEDCDKAVHYYKAALTIAREIGFQQGVSYILGNLANAYDYLEQSSEAISCHNEALEIARGLGDKLGEGSTLTNLGIVYNDLGEKDKARNLWIEALSIFEAIKSPFADITRQLLDNNLDPAGD